MNLNLFCKITFCLSALIVLGFPWLNINIFPKNNILGNNLKILNISQKGSALPLAEEIFLSFHNKSLSRVMTLQAIAETPARKTPVFLIGADAKYPVTGQITYGKQLSKETVWEIAKTYPTNQKPFEASVTQKLLDELGIPLGGGFRVGYATFMASKIIDVLPDEKYFMENPMPYALVPLRGFLATRLLGPASNVTYLYRVELPENISAEDWQDSFRKQFPDSKAAIKSQ